DRGHVADEIELRALRDALGDDRPRDTRQRLAHGDRAIENEVEAPRLVGEVVEIRVEPFEVDLVVAQLAAVDRPRDVGEGVARIARRRLRRAHCASACVPGFELAYGHYVECARLRGAERGPGFHL